MARVGIFSGTFDPVHRGHVEFCLLALDAAQLDKVVLLPERHPRGKQNVTDFRHRVEMLRRAIASQPRLEVRQLASGQFTVKETLDELRQLFPQDELVMLMGSDAANSFKHSWPDLEQLLAETDLVIGLRRGHTQAKIDELMSSLPHSARYQCIQSPLDQAASSQVRQKVGKIDLALHPEVHSYITSNRLYFGKKA